MTPDKEIALDAIIAGLERSQVANCFSSVLPADTHYATMPMSHTTVTRTPVSPPIVIHRQPVETNPLFLPMFPPIRARVHCWIQNVPSTLQRVTARWLRRRGWVVFYLDPEYRMCGQSGIPPKECWLHLYEACERHDSCTQ